MNITLFVFGIIGVIVSLAAVFYFSITEACLLAVSDAAIGKQAERGNERARAVQRLREDGDFIAAMNIGANAGALLIATLITVMVEEGVGDPSLALEQAAHTAGIGAILVLAEITPKSYGAMFPNRLALALAPSVEKFTRIFRHLIDALSFVANRLLGDESGVSGSGRSLTLGDLRAAAEVGEQGGALERTEGGMFEKLIELTNVTVRDIMIPRSQIVAVSDDTSLTSVLDRLISSGFSRLPVYEGDIAHIQGVLHVRDVLDACSGDCSGMRAEDVAGDVILAGPDESAGQLFREMRARPVHMAIVVDEADETIGLVTMEHILEELTGDIEDEHDTTTVGYAPTEEIEVSGETSLARVNRQLGLELPEDTHETLDDLLATLAGRVPTPGDTMRFRDAEFTVEEGDSNGIHRVRVAVRSEDTETA